MQRGKEDTASLLISHHRLAFFRLAGSNLDEPKSLIYSDHARTWDHRIRPFSVSIQESNNGACRREMQQSLFVGDSMIHYLLFSGTREDEHCLPAVKHACAGVIGGARFKIYFFK